MSAGHTPGPWEAAINSDEVEIYPYGISDKGFRYPMLDDLYIYVDRAGDSGIKLSDQDARLIAAAPELLGALISAREIISDIDEYQRRPGSGDYGVECACCMGELLDEERAAISRIDAAIAKAEGRS